MTGRALTFVSLSVFAAFVLVIFVGEPIGKQVGRAEVAAQLAPETAENRALIGALGDRIERLTETLAALTHEGVASWYGHKESGRLTANMERFNPEAMTAAAKRLPFGTFWRITRLDNGVSCVVRISDDGPNHPGRVIDLSLAAARALGMLDEGLVRVRVSPAGERT